MSEVKNSERYLEAKNIKKTYGPTIAVDKVDFSINEGEIIGLVGANGAGKSVMMRTISGVTTPDSGNLRIKGEEIQWDHYSPLVAKNNGLRIVFQELSLCTNLTVYENFYIEQPELFDSPFKWRDKARELAQKSLDTIFPNHNINVNATLSSYPIAQQQMIEIAKAVSDKKLELLILDEPTSSLGNQQTEQLLDFIKEKKKEGVSFIFISHLLKEVMTISDKICVLKNGKKEWEGLTDKTSEEDLVNKMGEIKGKEQNIESEITEYEETPMEESQNVSVEIENLNTDMLEDININMNGGEIVGIAGLEGSGQPELLRSIFRPKKVSKGRIDINGKVTYVSGDRETEGTFPLWPITKNMDINKLSREKIFQTINPKQLKEESFKWYKQLDIKGRSVEAPIVSLSGGNQQKVLIARALMSEADIILLDDPTRGVDMETKKMLYEILKEAAEKGKLIIWYSTEDIEFTYCTKTIVMRYGRIMEKLSENEITTNKVIEASFSGENEKEEKEEIKVSGIDFTGFVLPLSAMLAIFFISGILQNNVFSMFGISLLLAGAIPLVYAALAQTFIIGLSHVDISIGAYMGLINVICATYLYNNTLLGIFLLIFASIAYISMGVLIYYRKLPAIIVTLGASFIWIGLAITKMERPGGKAPTWLRKIYNFDAPLLPVAVYIILIGGVIAYVIYRSRYGTVLRGFGNNTQTMIRRGWSQLKAFIINYFIASCFGIAGGMLITAITASADPNAAKSYTLLTVAAVVMGGGYLSGGIVSPAGTVFGAVTLSLIGSLLGFMDISSNFVTAVQGGILILILALRLLRKDNQ